MHFKALSHLAALFLAVLAPYPAQAGLPEDNSAAVIYAYFSIDAGPDDGDETRDASAATLDLEDFRAQIMELTSGSYNVMGLPDLLRAQQSGRALPRRTVALTFDRFDETFVTAVAPYLIEAKIPFTVFVSPGQLDRRQGVAGWNDLRRLKDLPGVTIGLTAFNYGHLARWPREKLLTDLNQSRSRLREELQLEAQYYAYPYGEYSPLYRDLVEQQGFAAAFGQNSGVTHKDSDPLALPRFTITNEFSDIERLRLTSDALPLPVSDVAPVSMVVDGKPPFPGFTVPAALSASDLKSLTCFAAGAGRINVTILGKNRVELRFPAGTADGSEGFVTWRGRINCTLPAKADEDGAEPRWRWLGFLFAVPEQD